MKEEGYLHQYQRAGGIKESKGYLHRYQRAGDTNESDSLSSLAVSSLLELEEAFK